MWSEAAERIAQYFENEVQRESLRTSIYTFVSRLGLVQAGDTHTLHEIAQDILSEVFIEASTHASRYDPDRRLGAWLYGIALNVTKRKRQELFRRAQREPLFSSLEHAQESLNDEQFFEHFTSLRISGPEEEVEAREQFQAYLSVLEKGDQEILRLVILDDVDAKHIAELLDITPAAARQRTHRALNRLRTILGRQENRING
jgi:RNA polymerase sigma factor (sigma-70 family)